MIATTPTPVTEVIGVASHGVGKLLCETGAEYFEHLKLQTVTEHRHSHLGALSVSALTHITLDVSRRDAKKPCLLDIPETRGEVFRTVLGAPQVTERIKAGKTHIVLF